jgi:hypothetical protein
MLENADTNKILSFLDFFTKTHENGKSLLDLFKEVDKEKLEVENSYNIFKIVSDKWYLENFHTYIIASLLNPKEKHYQSIFLEKFLDIVDSGNKFPRNNLKDIIVETQKDIGKGIIDIFIYDENKNCIIIENKINNAGDQPDQINRYYLGSVNEGYNPVCIVYITPTLDRGVTKTDNKNINDILVHLPAYNRNNKEKSLWNWLEDCANKLVDKEINQNNLKDIIRDNDNSKIIELYTIIKQYQKLIKIHAMNEDALKSLVEKISGSKEYSKEYLEALCTIVYTKEIDPIYLLFRFTDWEKNITNLLKENGEINHDSSDKKIRYWRDYGMVWDVTHKFYNKKVQIKLGFNIYRHNNIMNNDSPYNIHIRYGALLELQESNKNQNSLDNLKCFFYLIDELKRTDFRNQDQWVLYEDKEIDLMNDLGGESVSDFIHNFYNNDEYRDKFFLNLNLIKGIEKNIFQKFDEYNKKFERYLEMLEKKFDLNSVEERSYGFAFTFNMEKFNNLEFIIGAFDDKYKKVYYGICPKKSAKDLSAKNLREKYKDFNIFDGWEKDDRHWLCWKYLEEPMVKNIINDIITIIDKMEEKDNANN